MCVHVCYDPVSSVTCCSFSLAMPDLIRLVHNSSMGVKKLVKTFRVHWGAKQPCFSAAPFSLEQPNSIQSPQAVTPSSNNLHTPTPSSEECHASSCNISKRQLENRILAIANKEVRSPKATWQVRQEILLQYGFSGAVDPLEVIGLNTANKPVDHPSGGGRGAKKNSARPPVKTLQDFFQNSPLSQAHKMTGSSTNGDRVRLSDHSHTPAKTLKQFLSPPLSSAEPEKDATPLPTCHQVARKLALVSETHPPKRPRLDSASSPIVIDSEESTDFDMTQATGSRTDEPMEVNPPKGTSAVLEECTNRPSKPSTVDASGLAKMNWQNQWAQNNRLEVSVDVHL